jgi:hypothetical protein
MGFDAGDSNLYRYVNNAPTDHTDPSGLAPRTINFYYETFNPATLNMVDIGTNVQNDVNRIFQSSVSVFAVTGSTLRLHWIPVSATALKTVKTGWIQTLVGYSGHSWAGVGLHVFAPYKAAYNVWWEFGGTYNPTPRYEKGNSVNIVIDQDYAPRAASTGWYGQSGGYAMTLYSNNLTSDAKAGTIPRKQLSQAIAITIAHEAGLHMIGGVKGHYFENNEAYVDAKQLTNLFAQWPTMIFSNKASTKFVKGLGFDLK